MLTPESWPNLTAGVDYLAAGHLAVLPPSIHPTGIPYRWAEGRALHETDLGPLPPFLRRVLGEARRLAAAEQAERSKHAVKVGRRRPATLSLAYGLTLTAVLARLEGVRRHGDHYMARCPAHEDRTPSLSIAQGARGRVLLYCHAGCAYPDIVHALYEGVPA